VGIGTTSPSQKLHVSGNIFATGTITPNSDRNAKTDFAMVDNDSILARVSKLKIQQWRFKAETEGVKHIGPMAQDFREAFGLGEIPTAIATVDADGVAFAAIQGLNDKVEQQGAELKEKETEIAELKTRLEKLERLMTSGK
jgi:trimeric autotransporter adhesin